MVDGAKSHATVIVGGGIIGFSTAFYLAETRRKAGQPVDITVVDTAPVLFAGASGGAAGVLGDYGFKPEADPLGLLSWELLKQLAKDYDGRKAWGFSDIYINNLYMQNQTVVHATEDSEHRSLPSWFKKSNDYRAELGYGPKNAGRLDPLMFSNFLLAKCVEMGVTILKNVELQSLQINALSGEAKMAIEVLDHRSGHLRLPFKHLVISAGPWSQRVLEKLFPSAQFKIPLELTMAAGNHLRLKTPGWTPPDDDKGCDQLYLKGILGHTLDISSFLRGTLYVGGFGGRTEPLPELATDVKSQPDAIEAMLRLCEKVLSVPEGESLEVLDSGRCFRPVLEQGRPIVTKVPLAKLFPPDQQWDNHNPPTSSVFLNVGHGSDGITLGPGSGKVMSELIQDLNPSANISGLGLP